MSSPFGRGLGEGMENGEVILESSLSSSDAPCVTPRARHQLAYEVNGRGQPASADEADAASGMWRLREFCPTAASSPQMFAAEVMSTDCRFEMDRWTLATVARNRRNCETCSRPHHTSASWLPPPSAVAGPPAVAMEWAELREVSPPKKETAAEAENATDDRAESWLRLLVGSGIMTRVDGFGPSVCSARTFMFIGG